MIRIVCVGKIKEKGLKELIAEYQKRLSAYTKIEFCEVNDEPAPASNSEALNEQVKIREGERILSQIKERDYVILLDLKGKEISSVGLSEKIEACFSSGFSDISFVIGGSLGVSADVKKRADYLWKLSDLTFPHQLVRLLLLEQIYRAFKIIHHEPYHK